MSSCPNNLSSRVAAGYIASFLVLLCHLSVVKQEISKVPLVLVTYKIGVKCGIKNMTSLPVCHNTTRCCKERKYFQYCQDSGEILPCLQFGMLVIYFVHFVRNNKCMSNLKKKKKKRQKKKKTTEAIYCLDYVHYIMKVNMTNILQLIGL